MDKPKATKGFWLGRCNPGGDGRHFVASGYYFLCTSKPSIRNGLCDPRHVSSTVMYFCPRVFERLCSVRLKKGECVKVRGPIVFDVAAKPVKMKVVTDV